MGRSVCSILRGSQTVRKSSAGLGKQARQVDPGRWIMLRCVGEGFRQNSTENIVIHARCCVRTEIWEDKISAASRGHDLWRLDQTRLSMSRVEWCLGDTKRQQIIRRSSVRGRGRRNRLSALMAPLALRLSVSETPAGAGDGPRALRRAIVQSRAKELVWGEAFSG